MQGVAQLSEKPTLMPPATIELSVIIVSWNTQDLLRKCLRSVGEELAGMAAEVFVIDNASIDGSPQMVANEFPWVRLVANAANVGFARANNQAMRHCAGRKVLLLNPDTEVHPGAILRLLQFMDQYPRAGVVAPQLLNSDGSIQRSCRRFPTVSNLMCELLGLTKFVKTKPGQGDYKMLDFDHDHVAEVDQPEGACLLVRREVIEEIGMLDEGYFMLFEEVDWCYAIKKAGWQIWFSPESKVTHHYGQSIKQVKAKMIFSSHRGFYRYWSKHNAGPFIVFAPFFYLALMAFALLRVAVHTVRQRSAGAS